MKPIIGKLSELTLGLLAAIEKLGLAKRSDKLLIAAFVVATLRQMGVNGHFIGYDPATYWPWFQPFEVLSGIAMAALEGIALAYVSRRWRKLDPQTWTEWVYWAILLVGQAAMLISVLVYVAMYAYAAQRGQTVSDVFSPTLNMIWNLMVAGVNPLIALLIGIVEDEVVESPDDIIAPEEEAWLKLITYIEDTGLDNITREELARLAKVDEAVAARVISKATKLGLLTDRWAWKRRE